MGMTMYIVRRLLLMIPTIFGVTLISFLIMQLAPGDPLLSQHSSSQGERETSRDAYLVQKRALGLDKPVLLNLNAWRDYHRTAPIVAHYLGRPVAEIAAEMPALAAARRDCRGRSDASFSRRSRFPIGTNGSKTPSINRRSRRPLPTFFRCGARTPG